MPMQAPQKAFAKRLIVLMRSSVIFDEGGKVSVAPGEERGSIECWSVDVDVLE